MAKLYSLAIAGSVSAGRILLEHAIGRPSVKIEWSNDNEFRVAGKSAAENDAEMIEYIATKIAEREAYERDLQAWQNEGQPMPSQPTQEPAEPVHASDIAPDEPPVTTPEPVTPVEADGNEVDNLTMRVRLAIQANMSELQIARNLNISPCRVEEIIAKLKAKP